MVAPLAIGWLTRVGCDPFLTNDADSRLPIGLIDGPLLGILGTLIYVYRPHNRIGWLCLTIAFFLPGEMIADLYVQCGAAGVISAPGMAYVAWFLYSYGTFAIIPLLFLLPMLYPTGRFLSPRWRWLTIACLLFFAAGGTGIGLTPDFSQSNGLDRYPVANPFGVLPLPDGWFAFFYAMLNVSFACLNLVGVAAMVVRFRRSVGDERQQMKWLAYFIATAIAIQMFLFVIPREFVNPQTWETIWFDLLLWGIFFGFPIVIGIAIFKYRLYAIDLIINRTLVYGGLTLGVVLFYVLTVGGLSLLFQTSGNFVIALIATGLIAVIFDPVREHLQGGVNRLIYGQRDDPYAVVSHLSQRLQTTAMPTDTLTLIVETVAAMLKLPYVAIELVEHEEQIGRASVGEPGAEIVEFPLHYQTESVGRLLMSTRFPGEQFTSQEQQLLADIAAQTGPVASAMRLTLALALPRNAGAGPRRGTPPHPARSVRRPRPYPGQPNAEARLGA